MKSIMDAGLDCPADKQRSGRTRVQSMARREHQSSLPEGNLPRFGTGTSTGTTAARSGAGESAVKSAFARVADKDLSCAGLPGAVFQRRTHSVWALCPPLTQGFRRAPASVQRMADLDHLLAVCGRRLPRKQAREPSPALDGVGTHIRDKVHSQRCSRLSIKAPQRPPQKGYWRCGEEEIGSAFSLIDSGNSKIFKLYST